MSDKDTQENKNNEIKTEEVTTNIVEQIPSAPTTPESTSQETSQPIQVHIVNEKNVDLEDQKRKEFFEEYDLLIRKMKDALDLIPPKPGRVERAWLWFQKHAFNLVLVFALGVTVGIGVHKIMVYNDTMDAVNKQIMEFKGDLFSIQPSAIKKYYVDGKKSILPISKKEEEPEQEVEPVKKTVTKR